jgi:hypothetical protein
MMLHDGSGIALSTTFIALLLSALAFGQFPIRWRSGATR